MFYCSECGFDCDNDKDFINHTRNCHKYSTSFTCGAKDGKATSMCAKSFSSFHSLRRHIDEKHRVKKSPSHVDNATRPSTSQNFVGTSLTDISMKHSDHESNFKIDEAQEECESTSPIEQLPETIDKNIENSNVQDIFSSQNVNQTRIDRNIEPHILFASKLHSFPEISRARIREIINYADQLHRSLLDELEKQIQETLSSSENVYQRVNGIFRRKSTQFF